MKVKIELTPYQALSILSFLREFINEENEEVHEFKAIHECVTAFENQVYQKVTDEMIEDAIAENEVNILIKKVPQNKGGRPIS